MLMTGVYTAEIVSPPVANADLCGKFSRLFLMVIPPMESHTTCVWALRVDLFLFSAFNSAGYSLRAPELHPEVVDVDELV